MYCEIAIRNQSIKIFFQAFTITGDTLQYPQYLTASFRHTLVELTVREETRLLHCINNYNHKRSCSIGPYERFVEKYSLFCKLECFIFVKILFHCPKMVYFGRPIPRFLCRIGSWSLSKVLTHFYESLSY